MDNQIELAYDAHHAALCSYLVSLTRDVAAAEDVTQEAYVRLAREIAEGRAPDNVRAWLFQVGRNLVISDARRRKTADRHRTVEAEPRAQSAEEAVLQGERDSELRTVLARLDPIDQRSLLMAALGYSGAEIGVAVGRSENAVRTRLCRARARLRVALTGMSA
jgi:RNA polymerase sigma-70 factor (ECF subfamily)